MPATSLPPVQETELALSVERAYREALVTDRLGAIWSLILAKCLLAQWAITQYSIPVSGAFYVWTLTLVMGTVASLYYLHAHRVKLYLLPTHFRVNAAVLAGLVVSLGFVAYARFALGAIEAPVAAALGAALLGNDIGAVQGIVEAAPACVGRIERIARVHHGDYQLRPGERGYLLVYICSADLEVRALGQQVADLLQEGLVGGGVIARAGMGAVPVVDGGLQAVTGAGDFLAVLIGTPITGFVFIGPRAGTHAKAPAGQIGLPVRVVIRVRREGMALGGAIAPPRCPVLAQAAISHLGGLMGCKKSNPHLLATQHIGDQIGHTHVAGVKSQVQRARTRACPRGDWQARAGLGCAVCSGKSGCAHVRRSSALSQCGLGLHLDRHQPQAQGHEKPRPATAQLLAHERLTDAARDPRSKCHAEICPL